MDFKDILKNELKAQRITAYQLAKGTGINKVSIHYYLKGEQEPTISKLKEICLYLDVSADYLLGLKEY